MNDLETRLRDALGTRASAVTHDTTAYDRIVRRRAHRRLTRLTAPVGAVAAAAAVAGLVAVVVRAPDRDAGPVAGGMPARLAAIRDDHAVVLDTRDLGGAPLASTTAAQGKVGAVAAVGDGQTFYATANRAGCRSTVLRLDASGTVTEVAQVGGASEGLAVTRDGRQLAYAVYAPGRPGRCDGGTTLRVRDLATGAERSWSVGEALKVQNLTWSPDARRVAFEVDGFSIGYADVTRAGGRAQSPSKLEVEGSDPATQRTCLAQAPAYLPAGELAAVVMCENLGTGEPTTMRVHVYDPVTQGVGRELFRLPDRTMPRWLAFDTTGRHALAAVTTRGKEGAAYRWDGTGRVRRVDSDALLVHVAW